ncbi:uncharacterized protein LOC114713154 [Neltuma alba]|uniref:uncharacterized protein LOC114713154 n=1 Tax=Neltuma alba TaxID=207710 RepID=UPI0010A3007C|nr:uncharacterized protein LOC114713154 [Prosopis alba]
MTELGGITSISAIHLLPRMSLLKKKLESWIWVYIGLYIGFIEGALIELFEIQFEPQATHADEVFLGLREEDRVLGCLIQAFHFRYRRWSVHLKSVHSSTVAPSEALVAVSSSVGQIQLLPCYMYGILIVGCSQIGIMNKKNGKASWDIRATKVFIDLCIEEVEKGGRRGTSLTKPAWTSIEENFTAKTGRVYTRIQLKNKYDTLRKEWQLWDRLLRETGLGWDAERNTVSAPDDWWEKKIVEVPGYEKFRERGLQFRAELTQLFGSVAATGPQSWAPSSMTLPSEGVPENDMEEGSGDSDEILGAPTGISGEFNSVTFNDNSGGSRGNTGMRQETIRGGRSTGGSRPSSSLGVRKKG